MRLFIHIFFLVAAVSGQGSTGQAKTTTTGNDAQTILQPNCDNNFVAFPSPRIPLQYFSAGQDAITVPFPETRSMIAGCPVVKSIQALKQGVWEIFPYPEDEQGGFSIASDGSLQVDISLDQFIMTVQPRYTESTDDRTLTIQFRYQLATATDSHRVHAFFDLVVEGKQNFCKAAPLTKTLTKCNNGRSVPNGGTCPNESVYLAAGQAYRGLDGSSGATRKLRMRQLSNWWSYRAVSDVNGELERVGRSSSDIKWSSLATDGSACPLQWQAVVFKDNGQIVPYEPSDQLFSLIEALDYTQDTITLRVPSQSLLSTTYQPYYNAQKRYYELTVGFRVYNKWRIPLNIQDQSKLLLFNMIFEAEAPYCSTQQPSFTPATKKETFLLTETQAEHTVTLDQAELGGSDPVCPLTYHMQVYNHVTGNWVQTAKLAELPFLSKSNDKSVTMSLNLLDVEKPEGELASYISSTDKSITYRHIAYDPNSENYAPVLELSELSELVPAEKRVAVQTVTVQLKDGTWAKTPIACERCQKNKIEGNGLLISYQNKAATLGALTKTLSPYEDVLGRPLGLSCVNSEFPARSSCQLGWQLGFIAQNGDFLEYQKAQSGLQNLVLSAKNDQIKLLGWANTDSPGSIDLKNFLDPLTRRYIIPIAVRVYNADSTEPSQGEAFYRFDLAFDPQDPVSCLSNSIRGNLDPMDDFKDFLEAGKTSTSEKNLLWPYKTSHLMRCPVPTRLQVYDSLQNRWLTVPTEDDKWEYKSGLADTVMSVTMRVPQDLDQPMKGIKVSSLDTATYYVKWLNHLSAMSADNSQVQLRLQYFDEIKFQNGIEGVDAFDAEELSEFKLQIAPEECQDSIIDAQDSLAQLEQLPDEISFFGDSKNLSWLPVSQSIANCPLYVNTTFESPTQPGTWLRFAEGQAGPESEALRQIVTTLNTKGLVMALNNEQNMKSWFDGDKYSQHYSFTIRAEFSNPVSSSLQQKKKVQQIKLTVEQRSRCAFDNKVSVKNHPNFYKVSNDPALSPEALTISVSDLFDMRLSKCKPNAQVTLTAYLTGAQDRAMTPVDDMRIATHFNGALQVSNYQDQFESFTLSASKQLCEENAPLLRNFKTKTGLFTNVRVSFKVIVEPEGYSQGPVQTSFQVAVTCLPCRRLTPELRRSTFSEMRITVKADYGEEQKPDYEILDLSNQMYAISEKGMNCPLVSELGFRDKNGNWNELAKALPGVTVSLKNDDKIFTVDGLTFEDVKRLDSSQMWTEDCDQYLWLDWRVHAKFSVDIEKYRRFSSDSGVTGRLYFSDSLCESTEPLAWWLILLIVVLVLLLICIIVTGLLYCQAHGRCCWYAEMQRKLARERELASMPRLPDVECYEFKQNRHSSLKIGPGAQNVSLPQLIKWQENEHDSIFTPAPANDILCIDADLLQDYCHDQYTKQPNRNRMNNGRSILTMTSLSDSRRADAHSSVSLKSPLQGMHHTPSFVVTQSRQNFTAVGFINVNGSNESVLVQEAEDTIKKADYGDSEYHDHK